jgi:putative ABC transport system permease protein
LLEAVVLSLVGGVLGVAVGIGRAVALAVGAGWPVLLSPLAVGLALLVTTGIGVCFGYYPALRASRLDPIEALRYE